MNEQDIINRIAAVNGDLNIGGGGGGASSNNVNSGASTGGAQGIVIIRW